MFEVLGSGELDQIPEVLVRNPADGQRTAADLARQVEAGTLRPNEA